MENDRHFPKDKNKNKFSIIDALLASDRKIWGKVRTIEIYKMRYDVNSLVSKFSIAKRLLHVCYTICSTL